MVARRGNILYKTIGLALFILLLAAIPRVWALDGLATPDEYRWVERSAHFFADVLTGQPKPVFEDGFPGVTTRWTGAAGLLLNYSLGTAPDIAADPVSLVEFLNRVDPTDFRLWPAIRLPTALIASICIVLVYLLARRMFGDLAGLLAGVLLALEPFLVGLSRLIHHDALVSSFVGVAVLSLLVYLAEDRTNKWLLLLAGLTTGLALLSKSTSLFLFPYALLVATATCWRWMDGRPRLDRMRARRVLVTLIIWGFLALLVVVALWPAMWANPLGTLGEVFSLSERFATDPHERGNFFLGQQVEDPGILFYPVAYLFRVTFFTLLGLFATLPRLWNQFRRGDRWPQVFYLVALWAFVLLFMAFMTFGAKKIDRYILPAIFFSDVLAGAGLAVLVNLLRHGLSRWLTTDRVRRAVGGLAVVVVLLIQAILLWPHVPYYISYYNPLLGGPPAAVHVLLVGWGEGTDQAARYLNEKPNAANLDVATWYAKSVLAPFLKGQAQDIRRTELDPTTSLSLPWYEADYVILYVNQVQRDIPTPELIAFFQAQEPEHVARIGGLEYAWTYRVPDQIPDYLLPVPKQPIYEPPAGDFGGQLTLVNYAYGQAGPGQKDIASADGTVSAGTGCWVALRWRTLTPMRVAYKTFIHVLDGQGRRVTQNDTVLRAISPVRSTDKLRPGTDFWYYHWFTIPAGTPPGDYPIQTGLYDPATGQRLEVRDAAGTPVGNTVTLGMFHVQRPATPPDPATLDIAHRLPSPIAVAEGLEVLGCDVSPAEAAAGQPFSVGLYWRAAGEGLRDYEVIVQLRDAAGTTWGRHVGRPADGLYPTSRWQAGEIVRDIHDLVVDRAVEPGPLRLTVSVRDTASGVVGPEVDLGTITVVGRVHQFTPPRVSHPMNVNLGNVVRLIGYDLDTTGLAPGGALSLTLYWQCLAPMSTSYTVFVHLADAGGVVRGQQDVIPCGGACPTTTWLPEEYLADTYQVSLPADAPAGQYELIVGLYDAATGVRLPLRDGSGDHVVVQRVTVP